MRSFNLFHSLLQWISSTLLLIICSSTSTPTSSPIIVYGFVLTEIKTKTKRGISIKTTSTTSAITDESFQRSMTKHSSSHRRHHNICHKKSPLFYSSSTLSSSASLVSLFAASDDNNNNDNSISKKDDYDDSNDEKEIQMRKDIFTSIVQQRYACTRFERYDGIRGSVTDSASTCHPTILSKVYDAINLSRRSPSGFNVQPYKIVVVSDPVQKLAMSRYCIGHNAHRVRDSDCTIIFLSDRQVMNNWYQYRNKLLYRQQQPTKSTKEEKGQETEENDIPNKWKSNPLGVLKIRALISLFSSGIPLPYIIASPISWFIRVIFRITSWMFRSKVTLPTLSSAETWSQKNTMLVAMTYMLACTSQSIVTCPMEGYLSWGIRQSLRIPRRYTIPLIVATGRPYHREGTSRTNTKNDDQQQPQEQQQESEKNNQSNNGKTTTTTTTTTTTRKKDTDDAGMSHGTSKESRTPRFPLEDIMFANTFGNPIYD